MIKVDCYWELQNIGKKTVEIAVEDTDIYESTLMERCTQGYDYVVVKVPMNAPSFNFGLSNLGYTCIENQMKVGIEFMKFDFSRVAHLYDETSYKVVDNLYDFKSVLSLIQPGMFSTDRVSIDPAFGESIGCQRYINWLISEYDNKKSQLIKVLFRKEHVGFMLVRIEGNSINLLLNGLYKNYQKRGLGLLTPASPMIFVKKNGLRVEKEQTSISSNNIPVVKLYNKLNFQLLQQKYVFIKHFK